MKTRGAAPGVPQTGVSWSYLFPCHFLVLGIAFAGALLASNARAESYPVKPIRLIVPFAPGGPMDILARCERKAREIDGSASDRG